MRIKGLLRLLRRRDKMRLLKHILIMRREIRECKESIAYLQQNKASKQEPTPLHAWNLQMPEERPWHS